MTFKKILAYLFIALIFMALLSGCEDNETPTVEPTETPTVEPTETPTVEPTETPTVEPTETPTVEPTETPTPLTNYDKSYTLIAETKLVKKLEAPFEIGYTHISKSPTHSHRNDIYENKLVYVPDYGYLGEDSLEITMSEKNNNKNEITIKVDIHMIKPPLEGNRDYTISYSCDDSVVGYAKNFDIKFYDDGLNLLDILYDDNSYPSSATYRIIPRSTMKSVNNDTSNFPILEKHYSMFKKYFNNIMQFTCNTPTGFVNLIYPIDLNDEKWYATKSAVGGNRDVIFSRNDLFFYVSILSELHSKVYLKSYLETGDKATSFLNANKFMEKVFPNSHYGAELLNNFNIESKKWDGINYRDKFNKENEVYYDVIEELAKAITNGDINMLLEQIAENYKSYYLSGTQKCLNKTICGTLFPEYTTVVNQNNKFDNGLNSWQKNENLVSPATGKIEFLPTNNSVILDYIANRSNGTDDNDSSLDLYQTFSLNESSIDDYFFKFTMEQVYGGADGAFPAFLGRHSSGFAGVYVCFNTKEESLGCIAWSDHLNKWDMAWGPSAHSIESNSRFYNIRLNNVIRRVKPSEKDVTYIVDLSLFLEKNLPEVYKLKDTIKSIEYGIYTTEFRSQNNGCYFCEAKVKANEISLLKIKNLEQ